MKNLTIYLDAALNITAAVSDKVAQEIIDDFEDGKKFLRIDNQFGMVIIRFSEIKMINVENVQETSA